jgi:hypothetical protein
MYCAGPMEFARDAVARLLSKANDIDPIENLTIFSALLTVAPTILPMSLHYAQIATAECTTG